MDNFGYIPEDIIINIFLRLPVKTLLRFKCVCKSWCSIIASCSFIYEHLDMALADSRKARLLVMHRSSETSEFFLFPNDQLMTPTHLTIHTKFPPYLRIMGPCHGLLCLSNDDNSELCLWNPATREIKYIPESPIPIPSEVDEYEFAEFGFGFDCKTRDYKVVKLLKKHCEDRDNDYHVELYTLSTNSWRKIDVIVPSRLFPYIVMYSCTTYMNGTFYWWAETVIVCFDMSNEQFGMIHLPKVDFPLNEEAKYNCFTEYNGLLAVIFCFQNENDTWSELWSMNGHGMTVNWTKQFSIGWLEGWWRPIGSYKNNRILFVSGYLGGNDMIIPYDHEARSLLIALPINPELLDSTCSETVVAYYTESLVSLGDG
ncbi:F-box/kelch-repeat protein At3g23880-like [Olea europaea var. sylvestris]|uniref:F-box/kelch-repeat protein At3g23880-like n=1 Tax=Olea europaea var. sylvestris TaxID=158386 RepID=UPI000C1D1326|nr:F-box/kelch-repeat protein At3g23880-like [Olea europaea var. sylvestris]